MAIPLAIGMAFLLSGTLLPLILRLARAKGWYDHPEERKIHNGQVPRLGGVGFFWAFLLSLLLCAALGLWPAGLHGRDRLLWIVLLGAFLIHGMGLVDDFKNIRARYKFAVQLGLAVLLVSFGFRFRVLILPFGDGVFELGMLSAPLTLLWIIGVTNAMNLIDGMDGQAGAIAAVASAVFGVFFLARGNPSAALVCFALLGAVGGFLVFNLPLPKARIFMGDSGSLFLGFILSALPLLGPADGVIEIGLVSAATTLLIPIYDTFTAILRRTQAGVSFFSPDRRHLHHKLLALGLSSLQALGIVLAATLLLGLAALSTLFLPLALSFWLKIGLWILFAGLLILLHFASAPKLALEAAARPPEPGAPPAPLKEPAMKETAII